MIVASETGIIFALNCIRQRIEHVNSGAELVEELERIRGDQNERLLRHALVTKYDGVVEVVFANDGQYPLGECVRSTFGDNVIVSQSGTDSHIIVAISDGRIVYDDDSNNISADELSELLDRNRKYDYLQFGAPSEVIELLKLKVHPSAKSSVSEATLYSNLTLLSELILSPFERQVERWSQSPNLILPIVGALVLGFGLWIGLQDTDRTEVTQQTDPYEGYRAAIKKTSASQSVAQSQRVLANLLNISEWKLKRCEFDSINWVCEAKPFNNGLASELLVDVRSFDWIDHVTLVDNGTVIKGSFPSVSRMDDTKIYPLDAVVLHIRDSLASLQTSEAMQVKLKSTIGAYATQELTVASAFTDTSELSEWVVALSGSPTFLQNMDVTFDQSILKVSATFTSIGEGNE